jgi:hypothetical protein
MRCIFTLSTARCGTRFLAELAKRNLRNATCRHEPYFDWGNSPMFGPAIAAHTRGELGYVRAKLSRKRRYIESLRSDVYVETSHAFLKSYYDLATEFFDDIKVLHLVRDPLRCALSESIRTQMLDRVRAPYRRYRDVEGRSCLRWSLTGYEPIFAYLREREISRFQFHLVEWIELQNRAVAYLDRFDKYADCVTLDSPRLLNDPAFVADAFRKLGLELRRSEVLIAGNHNRTFWARGRPAFSCRDQAAAVLRDMPDGYFDAFRRPTFAGFGWTADLLNRYAGPDPALAANLAGDAVA